MTDVWKPSAPATVAWWCLGHWIPGWWHWHNLGPKTASIVLDGKEGRIGKDLYSSLFVFFFYTALFRMAHCFSSDFMGWNVACPSREGANKNAAVWMECLYFGENCCVSPSASGQLVVVVELHIKWFRAFPHTKRVYFHKEWVQGGWNGPVAIVHVEAWAEFQACGLAWLGPLGGQWDCLN